MTRGIKSSTGVRLMGVGMTLLTTTPLIAGCGGGTTKSVTGSGSTGTTVVASPVAGSGVAGPTVTSPVRGATAAGTPATGPAPSDAGPNGGTASAPAVTTVAHRGSVPTPAATSTGAGAGAGGSSDSSFCQDTEALKGQLSDDVDVFTETPAQLQTLEAQIVAGLPALEAEAPAQIKAEVAVVAGEDLTLYKQLEAAGFKYQNMGSAAISLVENPQYLEDATAISSYLSNVCGSSVSVPTT